MKISPHKNNILDVKLKNYFDLSILDLLTLEILLNQVGPIKRHSLYLEVNNFLLNRKDSVLLKDNSLNENLEDLINKSAREIKAISTSSFYNNLMHLEKKGLLKFIVKNKKVKAVEKTGITFYIIKVIFNNLMQSIISNVYKLPEESANFIKEKYNLNNLDPGLLILADEFQDFELDDIYEMSRNLTILTDKPRYKNLFKAFDNVTYTSIQNGVIREPEGFFNGIYIGRIQKNTDLYGLTTSDLIKEAIRVLCPGGFIVLSTVSPVESIDHLYGNVLLNIYNELNANFIFTEKDIRNLFEPNGISEIHFLNFHGYFITIAIKPNGK